MLQGTGSDVGKTVLVAGLCRLARRRGIEVRPFKPQNMSNNAAVADIALEDASGGEIGRAQWLQALACGCPSSVDMNPVLLKPQSDTGSQIVVHGRVRGAAKGRDYQALKPQLLEAVLTSFHRLGSQCDLVIVEGAGSAAEINLRDGDIANMGFASAANVPVILIGDIDRGGVIASLVGTHAILPVGDRNLIRGFLINKFRGDVSLFDDGLEQITQHTGWHSLGVVPYLDSVQRLPAEDSVVLERNQPNSGRGAVVLVPVLSRIANFDDLDPLRIDPAVRLVFVRPGEAWPPNAELVILPGSKSTIADLLEFREHGFDMELKRHVDRGGHVLGICGGYQMLGNVVRDPDGIEGHIREARGLEFLDIETVLVPMKTVMNRQAFDAESGEPLEGYEIHMGQTSGPDTQRPMIHLDGCGDGAVSSDGRIRGCYLHGLFTNDSWRSHYLGGMGIEVSVPHYRARVEQAMDDFADQLEQVIDPAIWHIAS